MEKSLNRTIEMVMRKRNYESKGLNYEKIHSNLINNLQNRSGWVLPFHNQESLNNNWGIGTLNF